MLFRWLFRKELGQYDSKQYALLKKIGQLERDKAALVKKCGFQEKSFERIKHLVNKTGKKKWYIIECTNKGTNVLSIINSEELIIEIYNIDKVEPQEGWKQKLWATIKSDNLFIDDIQGGNSQGHGEIAMNHLIDYAIEIKAKSISGDISKVDYSHIDRLKAFYKKMKFEIIYDGGEYPTSVFRKL